MSTEQEAPKIDPWAVLHLFFTVDPTTDGSAIAVAIKDCESSGNQVITTTIFGHKADLCVMAIGPNETSMRVLQSALSRAGCALSYSYVSRTEISEYAAGMPEAMLRSRLQPTLPPANMPAFCFYPMSKKREGNDNWFSLDYDTRRALMMGHGAVGRTFAGRVLQVISGSTGLDDYEWGVTLFGLTPDELKTCVYEMRFDEGSARYAEFGGFLYGTVGTPQEVLSVLGVN